MVLAPDITKKPPNKLTTKYNEISTEYNEDSIEYNGFSTEYNGINTEYNGVWTEYNEICTPYNEKSTEYKVESTAYKDRSTVHNGISTEYNEISTEYNRKKYHKTVVAFHMCDQTKSHSLDHQEHPLKMLYEVALSPIVDLVDGDELVISAEGPLCLAPYAAE